MNCKHEDTIKIILPITDETHDKLSYEEVLNITRKLINEDAKLDFNDCIEILACVNCKTILEQNYVITQDALERLEEMSYPCHLIIKRK